MFKNPFAQLTDAELTALGMLAKALAELAEPLIDAGKLRGDDWQLPVDALVWQGEQLGAEIEARGLRVERVGVIAVQV